MDEAKIRVELTIACKELINLDTFSKSDPMVVMYTLNQNSWIEFGRTEIIWDNLNPKFVKSFTLDYHFEQQQKLKFVCVDIDNENSKNVNDQDFIGEVQCTLGEIVGSRGGMLVKPLIDPKNMHQKRGFLQVRSEEVQGLNDEVTFIIQAKNLAAKGFFGFANSDPFLEISKSREDNDYTPVYKSELHKSCSTVRFNKIAIPVEKLCNGDYYRQLRITIYHHKSSGSHQEIGHCQVTLDQLRKSVGGSLPLAHYSSKDKKHTGPSKNTGTLILETCKIERVPSFLEYVRGGYEINMMCAIDFTQSNGPVHKPDSLHYLNPNPAILNEYQKAIISVGNILNYYDSDKKYPVFGFGGFLVNTGVSHCFPLNLNYQNPEVYGIEGIMQAYVNAIRTVKLYGPTNFAQIINTASGYARESRNNYTILLIITDGEICDMDATVHEIVEASTLPLSIIIVGVGSANFDNMEVLDADDAPLVSKTNGKKMARDIVQFVPFSKFKNCSIEMLAEEVLREVPGQFVSYMLSKGIKPPQPVRVGSFIGSQSQPQAQPVQQMPPSTPTGNPYNAPFQQPPPQQPIYPMPPPQQQGYPPQQQGYPPQQPMNYQQGYPPQQSPYPNNQQQQDQFSAQQSWKTAGHAVMFANAMTPQQQPPQGYPPQQQNYPPQQNQPMYNNNASFYDPNGSNVPPPPQNPELYGNNNAMPPTNYRI